MRRKGRGEITKIGNLFEVYKLRLRAPQGAVVKTFQEIMKDLFKVEVRSDQCSYSVATKTLRVTLSGPLRTEMMLRKTEVLTHLRGRLGDKGAPTNIL